VQTKALPKYVDDDIATKHRDGYEIAFIREFNNKDESDSQFYEHDFYIGYYDVGAPFSGFMCVTKIHAQPDENGEEFVVTLETFQFQTDIMLEDIRTVRAISKAYWEGKC
jgi:hypothetical protein